MNFQTDRCAELAIVCTAAAVCHKGRRHAESCGLSRQPHSGCRPAHQLAYRYVANMAGVPLHAGGAPLSEADCSACSLLILLTTSVQRRT